MRIIGDTNIPFLSYRKIALSLSVLVILGGLAYEFLGPGLNLGIDFVGGSQVNLKFRDRPDLGTLRSVVSEVTPSTPVIIDGATPRPAHNPPVTVLDEVTNG